MELVKTLSNKIGQGYDAEIVKNDISTECARITAINTFEDVASAETYLGELKVDFNAYKTGRVDNFREINGIIKEFVKVDKAFESQIDKVETYLREKGQEETNRVNNVKRHEVNGVIMSYLTDEQLFKIQAWEFGTKKIKEMITQCEGRAILTPTEKIKKEYKEKVQVFLNELIVAESTLDVTGMLCYERGGTLNEALAEQEKAKELTEYHNVKKEVRQEALKEQAKGFVKVEDNAPIVEKVEETKYTRVVGLNYDADDIEVRQNIQGLFKELEKLNVTFEIIS
jgi:hypothetical protein